jgi:hypothetical protein
MSANPRFPWFGRLAAAGHRARRVGLLAAAILTATALVAPAAAQEECDLACQGVLVANSVPLDAVVADADPGAAVGEQRGADFVALIDTDGDGLTDADEALYAADPGNPDSDFDTIPDGAEIHTYGTLPWTWDTDGDVVGDAKELFVTGTNPRSPDSDADGYSDYQELYTYFTDPNDYDSYPVSQGRRQ